MPLCLGFHLVLLFDLGSFSCHLLFLHFILLPFVFCFFTLLVSYFCILNLLQHFACASLCFPFYFNHCSLFSQCDGCGSVGNGHQSRRTLCCRGGGIFGRVFEFSNVKWTDWCYCVGTLIHVDSDSGFWLSLYFVGFIPGCQSWGVWLTCYMWVLACLY